MDDELLWPKREDGYRHLVTEQRDTINRLIARAAAAEARVAALEAALAALVAVDPIVRYGQGSFGCHFCDDESAMWAHRAEQVEHTDACPWLAARRLVGGREGTC
jgi:hypothetical protein